MPNRIHGAIQAKFIVLLDKYSKSYQFISELSLDTTPGSTPDISIFPKKKLDLKTVTAKETEAPLTAIEIQSPTQSIDELQKMAWELYFPFGIKTMWIVIPSLKAVQVLTANDQQTLFYSGNLKDAVTGIELSVEQIFEDLI